MKQVILIRKDLKMRRGKEIAQGAHAAMEFLVQATRAGAALNETERVWLAEGTAKVCLQVDSETELLQCHRAALAAGLKSFLIEDAGRTEFHGQKTLTAGAIGPDAEGRIDAITGHLKLY